MSESREFWLVKRFKDDLDHYTAYLPMENPAKYSEHIHVIEYSALEQIKKERDELEVHYKDCCNECQESDESVFNLRNALDQALLDRQILLDALDYYAKKNHYMMRAGIGDTIIDTGEKARAAIGKITK